MDEGAVRRVILRSALDEERRLVWDIFPVDVESGRELHEALMRGSHEGSSPIGGDEVPFFERGYRLSGPAAVRIAQILRRRGVEVTDKPDRAPPSEVTRIARSIV